MQSPEPTHNERSGHTPLLEVRGLKKSFRGASDTPIQVLNGVDLQVGRGEVIAITGESGSGKSTLLQILGALDRPDEGEVTMAGTDVFSQDDEALSRFRNQQIGFVFQFHHLLPEFTAEENVMMPALVHGAAASAAKTSAHELLARVGLQDRMDHRPGELSGGEKQRVAMARALMNEPDLILADEPTGNLDENTADRLHAELVSLSRELGQTFVIVTHNRHFARMADRELVLEHGVLASCSTHGS